MKKKPASDKPTFQKNDAYENIIELVNDKRVRLDSNNDEHIAVAKYSIAKATFQQRLADWYSEQYGSVDTNELGEIKFCVTLHFSGIYEVDVFAEDEESAIKEAESEFNSEFNCGWDNSEIDIDYSDAEPA